jgi:hypothetical protein
LERWRGGLLTDKQSLDKQGELVKSLRVEQNTGCKCALERFWEDKIGVAHCQSGVGSIWQSDDEVRIGAVSDAQNGDLLSFEGMEWMGDCDDSGRGIGLSLLYQTRRFVA